VAGLGGSKGDQQDAASHAEARKGRLELRVQGVAVTPPRLDAGQWVTLVIALAGVVVSAVALLAVPFLLLLLPMLGEDPDRTISPNARPIAAGVGVVLLLLAWIAARRLWALVDTPTIPIGSAVGGRCEVEGTVVSDSPVTTWFTARPAAWFESTIHTGVGKRRRLTWKTTAGTAACRLDGDDGSSIDVDLGDGPRSWRRTVAQEQSGAMVAHEQALLVGDRLFVLGDVTMGDDGRRRLAAVRATLAGEVDALRKLRRWTWTALLLAAACAAYAAATTTNDDRFDQVLVLRPQPGAWAATAAAGTLVVAVLAGAALHRAGRRRFDLGTPVP
jgi:hypothetical protein